MTTVGYGGISPEAGGGKVVAVVLMLAGITLSGAISANLAAWFAKSREVGKKDELARKVSELTTVAERFTEQIDGDNEQGFSHAP